MLQALTYKSFYICFIFQVCIRVYEEKYYRFDPFHVYDAYHELYWYNEIDHKHGGKIPGLTLPCKIVTHALKTFKEMKVISRTLKEKESNIKKESEKRYKNFMEGIEYPPNTPGSGFSKLSDGVSNESLKRVQTELMKQFSEMKESLRKTQNVDSEKISKMEETLRNSLGAEKERFSKMEETLRNTQGFQDAERERFSKLEETLGNIQGSLDAERERFSKLEESLRTCIQDSLQKQA